MKSSAQLHQIVKHIHPSNRILFNAGIDSTPCHPKPKMIIPGTDVYKGAYDFLSLVLSSEWSKLDTFTYSVYIQLFSNKGKGDPRLYVEGSPFVQAEDRQYTLGGFHAFWVHHEGGMISTYVRDEIELHWPVQLNETDIHLSFCSL